MNKPYLHTSGPTAGNAAAGTASAPTGAAAAANSEPDIDSRILAAERAVIERDERIYRDASEVARRLHLSGGAKGSGGASSSGLAGGGAGSMLAKMLFSRGSSGGGVSSETGKHAAGGAAAAGLSSLIGLLGKRSTPRWAPLLALAWPLAPRALQSRIGPATATALLGLAVPLIARSKTPKAEGEVQESARPVESAPRVDLRRFAGRWFEVARFPVPYERGCDRDVSAMYTLHGKELRVVNRCTKRNGQVKTAEGRGRPVWGGNGARLKVSFAPQWLRWLPGSWSPYWILRIDPDYRTALVGTPDRKSLWLLSRTRRIDDGRYTRMVEHARAQGFDVSRLRETEQT
jgi:lipocalin